jgi:hypothetical protein
VFQDLVLARIIEPSSKHDSLRVLGEVGVEAPVGFQESAAAPTCA